MDLFLIRHAIAELRRPELPDEERALTAEGKARFGLVVAGLSRLGIQFDRIYHSPWKRALETAELAAPLAEDGLVVHSGLAGSPSEEMLTDLVGDRVALVGHEPWMGELLSWLVCENFSGWFRMKKGSVAWLRGQPFAGQMELRALIPPKVFRELQAPAKR